MFSPRFLDQEIQKEFDINGFALVRNAFNKTVISQLLDLFYQYYKNSEENTMWNSLYDLPFETSVSVGKKILDIIHNDLNKYLTEYVSPTATFMVKHPLKKDDLPLHRDFSIMDEDEFSYINIWIPLVDTDRSNGQLFVLPKSHKYFTYPRPFHTPWAYLNLDSMLRKYCIDIDAHAGDIIFYGDKTLHGSHGNFTESPRPVVHFGVVHPFYKLRYYDYHAEENIVYVYEIPNDFFFGSKDKESLKGMPVARKFTYEPPSITPQHVVEWFSASQ
ncbi:MAG: phytanoyl-CoA dioxygenase family protein [Chitinophagales bacterium]|nr:phytanoyl-CoA dioxygenase family protein [Chitinophagales bacterium]MDW8273870.1 phytanoyl-CoA dioxygenase family protein [Chitinophagales bacterium]